MSYPQFANVGMAPNLCLTSAGITGLSGAATTFSTGGTKTFMLNGDLYTRAAFAGAATPTTDVNTGVAFRTLAVNQGSVYVWLLEGSGGTIRVAQGSIEQLDSAGNFLNAPQFPQIPDGAVAIAYSVVRAGSTYAGSGFRFGSDNWNTTGITIASRNVGLLPPRPRIN